MVEVAEGRLLPVRWPVSHGTRGWQAPVPYGVGACGMCATILEGRRRRWCSDYCADLAAICSNPQAARDYLWYNRDKGVCAHCPPGTPPWPRFARDSTNGWETDHIVPLHMGGSYMPDNLQTLCLTHHRAKSATETKARALLPRIDPSIPRIDPTPRIGTSR